MPVTSLGEILYITEREQSLEAAHSALAAVDQLPIEVTEAGRALTLEAAHVKAHHTLSYADAFVVALAQQRDARVVTGDPEFRQAEERVAVVWLPQV
jgi:predicted nucleic acid-binding protein